MKLLIKKTLLLLLIGLALSACTKDAPPEKVIRPVVTQQVDIRENWQQSSYAGEVKARYKMSLGFRIGGKIVERFVEVGNVVVPGTLLARLDPEDFKLQLMIAEASLEEAEAVKKKTEQDFKRYTQLYKEKMVSATEHLNFSNALAVAKAQYTQADAHLEVTRNQLDYTRLYADKGGVVTALDMEVGQVVIAGQTVIKLALPDEKEVIIAVAENRLDEIHHADEINISLWVNPDKFYQGKVREISPGADPATRTYQVKISLIDADERVQLGMTTTVTIQQKQQQLAAKLPLTSVFQKGSQAAVWIYSPETSTVSLQSIEIAAYQFDSVLVHSGIQQGQIAVTAGVHKLHEGQKVRLMHKQKTPEGVKR